MLRLASVVAAVAVALLALPAGATPAAPSCDVPSFDVLYETPHMEMFTVATGADTSELVACLRPNGARRPVAENLHRSEDSLLSGREAHPNAVIDDRFVWATTVSLGGIEAPVNQYERSFDTLVDARTGRATQTVSAFEDETTPTWAGAGVLMTDSFSGSHLVPRGLHARSTSGTSELLAPGDDHRPLGASNQELFWQDGDILRARPYTAPTSTTSDPRAPAIPATATVLRQTRAAACETRRAQTVLRADRGDLVVVRTPHGEITACDKRHPKTTVLTKVLKGVAATGAPTDIADLAGPGYGFLLRYRFSARTAAGPTTALVVLNVVTGRIVANALTSTVTEWAADDDDSGHTVIAYTDGNTLTRVSRGVSKAIDHGTIANLTLGSLDTLFWTNAGVPNAISDFASPEAG